MSDAEIWEKCMIVPKAMVVGEKSSDYHQNRPKMKVAGKIIADYHRCEIIFQASLSLPATATHL